MKAVAVFPHTQEVKLIDHEESRILQPTHVKLRMLDLGAFCEVGNVLIVLYTFV